MTATTKLMTAPSQPNGNFSDLAPGFGLRLKLGIRECRAAGLRVGLHDGFRSTERQSWLYAQGRTRPGNIVTNARTALRSWHGFGLAGDVVFQKADGDWTWAVKESDWQAMLDVMSQFDLTTGLHWQSPPDGPHVQPDNLKKSPSERSLQLYSSGGLVAVWKEVGHLMLPEDILEKLAA